MYQQIKCCFSGINTYIECRQREISGPGPCVMVRTLKKDRGVLSIHVVVVMRYVPIEERMVAFATRLAVGRLWLYIQGRDVTCWRNVSWVPWSIFTHIKCVVYILVPRLAARGKGPCPLGADEGCVRCRRCKILWILLHPVIEARR